MCGGFRCQPWQSESVCVSVLLQSLGQQLVEAGDHGAGVVVEAGSDHGVVVDLRDGGRGEKRYLGDKRNHLSQPGE